MSKNGLKVAPLTRSGAIQKKVFMKCWADLTPSTISPEPIPYKHRGTTIDQDGIRITGSLGFIESVLSHLKHLLKHENSQTRLQVSCSELSDRDTGERIPGRFRVSIQVHERGDEAKILHTRYGS